MAKTSQKVRQARKAKFEVREYTRCERCGLTRDLLPLVAHPCPPAAGFAKS